MDRLSDSDRAPNGLFTRVLLKEMNRPGVSVDRVLRNVRDQVVKLAKNVNHDQVPALYDQAIGDFYFKHGVVTNVEPSTIAHVQSPAEIEQQIWDELKDSANPNDFKLYLKQYPDGRFAALAHLRLKKINAMGGNLGSSIVDARYARGFGPYEFGMSPEAVNAHLPRSYGSAHWAGLPVAGEYKVTEVRYFWQTLNNFSGLPFEDIYGDCIAGSSYLTFLFDESGLFRLSLRLMSDCQIRNEVLRRVAESVGAPIKPIDGGFLFRLQGRETVFTGVAGHDVASLEWTRDGAPKHEGQSW